jgi:Histidinol phosphatase and related hydrolases of the PHP family
VEFKEYYEEIIKYNEYQSSWYNRRSGVSLQSYINLVQEYKSNENKHISVKWGLEVCYLPGIEKAVEKLRKQNIFDFYTGSIHWIRGWGFDHKKEFWADKNIDEVYTQYFDEEKQLLKSGVFDHLGHPDSIKCFDYYPSYKLDKTYDEIINEAKTSGITFEQSCGLYNNYGHTTIGLESTYLKKLKENNIKLITASDAHCPEDVGKNIAKALTIMNNA